MYPTEADSETSLPVFAAFSDLLACVLGIFVLFFVSVVSFEISTAEQLEHERAARVHATGRLRELEAALAGPLREGLITFVDGTIGIRGNLLFDVNSAQLRSQGDALLHELAQPLSKYLAARGEVLMVSGFTDDLQIRVGPMSAYRDNWELSVQRSVTVVRALIGAGVSADLLFAAGFGENHPLVPNDSELNRARNRRVEMSPVPRPRKLVTHAQTGGDPGPAGQSDGGAR
jgi:outer membrane protein OmpA-like peptidoglycan-associated protein